MSRAAIDPDGGYRLLLARVIEQSVEDATGKNAVQRLSALRYFCGPVYTHHCTLLDIPVRVPPAVRTVMDALSPDELRKIETYEMETA